MLTDEIVSNFLVDKLKLIDWKLKLEKNKLDFLRELIVAHEINIYFQHVTWSHVPKSQRKIPTIEEVIENGKNGLGGTCIQLNYFLHLILQHLGYDAFIVGADAPLWPTRKSHMAVVVRFANEHKEELYLIDVGFGGRPFLEPIPLHKLPYIGKAGGFIFEYRFNEENQVYERFLHQGCPVTGKLDAPTRVDFHFKLKPLKFEDFSECFENLFSPRASERFLDVLLLSRMIKAENVDNFEYICIRRTILTEGTKDTYKETTFTSYESMLPTIQKLFPQLNWKHISAAILNYNQFREAQLAEKEQAV